MSLLPVAFDSFLLKSCPGLCKQLIAPPACLAASSTHNCSKYHDPAASRQSNNPPVTPAPVTKMQYTGNGAAPPQAVSSKRMTYGAISSNQREARERQELFAGASDYRSPYQQQQHMSQDELMQQAVTTLKDTTATARRALQVSRQPWQPVELVPCTPSLAVVLMVVDAAVQVLEQTKEIQGNTQAALVDQREQMYRIEEGLDKVGVVTWGGGDVQGHHRTWFNACQGACACCNCWLSHAALCMPLCGRVVGCMPVYVRCIVTCVPVCLRLCLCRWVRT